MRMDPEMTAATVVDLLRTVFRVPAQQHEQLVSAAMRFCTPQFVLRELSFYLNATREKTLEAVLFWSPRASRFSGSLPRCGLCAQLHACATDPLFVFLSASL